jgi:glycosyltransferase involved in cell wall biosynthesis
MRIGIDARLFKAGLGIGRYIEQLLLHLETLESDDEYIVFLRKEMMDVYRPMHPHFKKVCLDIPWYSFSEQCIAPVVFLMHNVDVMHFPHFNVPLLYPKKYILTIHDLIMIKHAGSSKSAATTLHPLIHAFKYRAYRFVLKRACMRASSIIAVSESVKQDMADLLAIPKNRIHVIHEGCQLTEYQDILSLPSGVRKPYFINVGNAYPHKNILYLLDVFDALKKEGAQFQLVVCGQEDVFRDRVIDEIAKRNLQGTVIHLGYVSDRQLASLYRQAQAALFPSLEEGFGFGPLEAALLGIPVIVSKIPVFKEILGNAALYIDPFNPHDMIEAIKKSVSDEQSRKNQRAKGLSLREMYSWERTAKMTSEQYHL